MSSLIPASQWIDKKVNHGATCPFSTRHPAEKLLDRLLMRAVTCTCDAYCPAPGCSTAYDKCHQHRADEIVWAYAMTHGQAVRRERTSRCPRCTSDTCPGQDDLLDCTLEIEGRGSARMEARALLRAASQESDLAGPQPASSCSASTAHSLPEPTGGAE